MSEVKTEERTLIWTESRGPNISLLCGSCKYFKMAVAERIRRGADGCARNESRWCGFYTSWEIFCARCAAPVSCRLRRATRLVDCAAQTGCAQTRRHMPRH